MKRVNPVHTLMAPSTGSHMPQDPCCREWWTISMRETKFSTRKAARSRHFSCRVYNKQIVYIHSNRLLYMFLYAVLHIIDYYNFVLFVTIMLYIPVLFLLPIADE